MKPLKKHATVIAISSLLLSGAALSHPPEPNVFDGGNKWRITFYNDSTVNHQQWATQEICFLPYAVVGTSIQGSWYSTSFPDWNGQYYQEGDEVKMTGDYANDVGHDHMTLLHTTYDAPGQTRGMAFKDWTEWREDGKFGNIIGWGNAKLERAGKCPSFIANLPNLRLQSPDLRKFELEAQEISLSLPDRLTVQGEIARFPGQSDLESLDDYQRRTGVEQFQIFK
jgi:hypothetical protein